MSTKEPVVYHIRPLSNGLKWSLKMDQSELPIKIFSKKEAAIEYAQVLGLQWRLDSFIVHKINGDLEAAYSFAELPRNQCPDEPRS